MRPSLTNRALVAFQSRYVTFALRIILGGTLLLAGALKLRAYQSFVLGVKDYEILPPALASLYGYSLPWVEIIVGLLLIFGIVLRPAAALSILLSVSFVIAKAVTLYRGQDVICGCFGEWLTLLISQSLFIDVVMVVMAVQILFHRGEFLELHVALAGKLAHTILD